MEVVDDEAWRGLHGQSEEDVLRREGVSRSVLGLTGSAERICSRNVLRAGDQLLHSIKKKSFQNDSYLHFLLCGH